MAAPFGFVTLDCLQDVNDYPPHQPVRLVLLYLKFNTLTECSSWLKKNIYKYPKLTNHIIEICNSFKRSRLTFKKKHTNLLKLDMTLDATLMSPC